MKKTCSPESRESKFLLARQDMRVYRGNHDWETANCEFTDAHDTVRENESKHHR